MIKAVLFDLDGVLVDACDWHYNALNEALINHAFCAISRKDHETKFNGLPTRTKLEKLGISLQSIMRIEATKQEITKQYIDRDCKLDQSKINLFQYLRSSGMLVCIVTNCSEETARLMLKKIGVGEMYDFLVHNRDTKFQKPHPDPYFFAMARLGVKPYECLIVEDSPKGIEAAKASGAYLIDVKDSIEVHTSSVSWAIEAINYSQKNF